MISPVLTMVQKDMKWSKQDLAYVLSCFTFGYLWLQVAAGMVIQRYGSRALMSCALFGAGLSLAIASICNDAATIGYSFGLLGVTHAPMIPVVNSVMAAHIAPADQPAANLTISVYMAIGNMLSSFLSPHFVDWFGWKHTLRFFSCLSLLYSGVWYILLESSPEAQRKKQAAKPASTSFPMSLLFQLPVWAVFISHCAGNYGGAMLDSWSPTFYDEVLGLPPTQAASHQTAIRLAQCLAALALPRIVFPIVEQALRPTLLQVRRCSTPLGAVGESLCVLVFCNAAVCSTYLSAPLLLVGATLSPVYVATSAICCRSMFSTFHSYGFNRGYIELGGENVAILSAVGNTFANLGSYLAPVLGAKIYHSTGSWQCVYGSSVVVWWAASAFFVSFIALELPRHPGKAKALRM
jgi:ACS family glucarate transporter-like MFS transporter